MRIGIIAEGRSDLAVIANILRGLGIDSEFITDLQPTAQVDETDRYEMSQNQFSNWQLVRQQCIHGTLADDFLNNSIDEEKRVVIHIDTAEAELPGYDVRRPPSGGDYATELHRRVAAKLDEWLAGRGAGRIRYAIAVEETEAWTLTLYVERETSSYRDPKKTLERTLERRLSDKQRKHLRQLKDSDTKKYHDELSREFRKRRTLKDCATRNHSLWLFLEALSQDVEQSG